MKNKNEKLKVFMATSLITISSTYFIGCSQLGEQAQIETTKAQTNTANEQLDVNNQKHQEILSLYDYLDDKALLYRKSTVKGINPFKKGKAELMIINGKNLASHQNLSESDISLEPGAYEVIVKYSQGKYEGYKKIAFNAEANVIYRFQGKFLNKKGENKSTEIWIEEDKSLKAQIESLPSEYLAKKD